MKKPRASLLSQPSTPLRSTSVGLDLMARRIVMASYLYYRHDISIMSDNDFDAMCLSTASQWNSLAPFRQWQLGSRQEIKSSGFHVKMTHLAESAAWLWAKDQKHTPRPELLLVNWKWSSQHQLEWSTLV